jgi:hypothetical protein
LCADSVGPLDDTVVSRAVSGLAHRAEAAAEIARRLSKIEKVGLQ